MFLGISAAMAQLVEQLNRNQQVGGSIPSTSSKYQFCIAYIDEI